MSHVVFSLHYLAFRSIRSNNTLDLNLVKGERHERTSSHYTILWTNTCLDDFSSDCLRIARRTGFLKRLRKINPLLFLRALAVACFEATPSFRLVALTLSLLSSQSITKQAIAKKMDQQCLQFVRCAVLALTQRLSAFDKLRQTEVFQSFRRVLIQDSTHLRLANRLADNFPGPANQRSKDRATLKIQVVYDLLGESLTYFGLSGFRRTDQAASADILAIAQPGDLVLRDLGYFSTSVFKKLLDRGVHFLSRLKHNVSIRNPQTLALIDLLGTLRRDGRFDQQVLLSTEHKVPVRLVALPVPEQVANERRRKAKTNRDRRCNPSKEHLEMLGWNIFVTSVDSLTWDPETVLKIYGARWRIEIIFKTWKSNFNLTETPTGSALQVEVFIWAKLLAICLFQKLFGCLELYIAQPISLLKSAQFFAWLLIWSLTGSITAELRAEPIHKQLRLEKRKKYNCDSPRPLLS